MSEFTRLGWELAMSAGPAFVRRCECEAVARNIELNEVFGEIIAAGVDAYAKPPPASPPPQSSSVASGTTTAPPSRTNQVRENSRPS